MDLQYYDDFSGALVCMDYLGNHAAANYGGSSYSPFIYTYKDSDNDEPAFVESEAIETSDASRINHNIFLSLYIMIVCFIISTV